MSKKIEQFKDAETNPAYGQILTARVSQGGGGALLYGSDFQHGHYMVLTIYRSEKHRDLSHDWYFSREKLIEIAMSEAQYATFLSSPNMGDGTPCTIAWLDGERVPALTFGKDRKEQFSKELDHKLDVTNAALVKLREMIEGLKVSKRTKEALLNNADSAIRNLNSNTDYVASKFDEHMEKTVEKAKMEVNAYAGNTLRDLGRDALPEGDPPIRLLEGEVEIE